MCQLSFDHIDGKAVCYVWVKEDPLRTYKDIKSGTGTLTIVGELEGVPKQWEGKYNIKTTFPFEIRKKYINTFLGVIEIRILGRKNVKFVKNLRKS